MLIIGLARGALGAPAPPRVEKKIGVIYRENCVSAPSVGTCESFFLRSNRISNRIGRPIRFRIEFSNRIGRVYTREYLIHSIGIYFVFVTNESDARN